MHVYFVGVFEKLKFDVSQDVFLEIFKNPDNGFGFTAKINKKDINELYIETFDYLIRCQQKDILGAVNMMFTTSAVGEINSLTRRVNSITLEKNQYIIKNSY